MIISLYFLDIIMIDYLFTDIFCMLFVILTRWVGSVFLLCTDRFEYVWGVVAQFVPPACMKMWCPDKLSKRLIGSGKWPPKYVHRIKWYAWRGTVSTSQDCLFMSWYESGSRHIYDQVTDSWLVFGDFAFWSF